MNSSPTVTVMPAILLHESPYDERVDFQAANLAITVRLSRSDLFRSTFRKQIGSLSGWIIPVAVILVVVTVFRGNPLVMFAAAIAGFAMIFLFPWSLSKAAEKNPGALAPITYLFDDLSVSAVYINGENRSAWSLVNGAFETAKDVFVVMQRGSFHLIPKAQVNENELNSLRQILHRHLGARARLVKPIATVEGARKRSPE